MTPLPGKQSARRQISFNKLSSLLLRRSWKEVISNNCAVLFSSEVSLLFLLLLVPDFPSELACLDGSIFHVLVAVLLLVFDFVCQELSLVLFCEIDAILLELKNLLLFVIIVKVLMRRDVLKGHPAALLAQCCCLLESLLLDPI